MKCFMAIMSQQAYAPPWNRGLRRPDGDYEERHLDVAE
jgi:hypothetical protein